MKESETPSVPLMQELAALRQQVAALSAAAATHRQVEDALRESETKFRTLVQASLQGILVHHHHQPCFVNQAFATMFGYATPEEVLRLETTLPLIAPQDRARIIAYRDARLRGDDVPAHYEFQGLRRDGRRIWVEVRATVIPWDGAPAILTTHIDITARKQAEEVLTHYHLLSERAYDIILFIRRDGQIVEANQAAVMAYGYDRETLLTMTIYDLRGPTTVPQLALQMAQADQNGILFETLHRRKDGSVFPVEVSSIGTDIGGERLLLSIIRDITERKHAEEMREQLAAIVESSDEAIIGQTLEGIITSWNRGAARLYGYTTAEVLGQPIALLVPPESPDELPRILGRLQRGERIEHYETQRLHKDGTRLDVSLTISPIRDSTGRITGASKIARDITARKRAEEALRNLNDTLAQRVAERTAELSQANAALQAEILHHRQAREQLEHQQETLAHREKLAAMGSMLASVAHELNNPLAVVMMQADLLREEAGSGSLAAHATELLQAAEQCVEIIHHFLSLARQQPLRSTRVELNTVVETAMKLLTYPLRVDTIRVHQRLAYDLPALWADPHQLQQVVVNLVTNAHQALRETTRARQLTITTWADHAQQRVVLEVADTGPGIPPAVQQRIFEPFFTTKPPGVGTGLGLPICLGIVEGHGGTMSVESVLGRGTVARVALPFAPVPADVLPPEPAIPPAASEKSILIVDDEPGITRTLAYLLRRDGHTVETAANGRLAIEKCQERDYDLILCDLRMPELDGPGFYQELMRHHTDLCQRVMFLTGDTLSPDAQAFLEHTGVPQLYKPFTASMVRKAIQRL
jgi:PAS domain S-box-containing protein